MLYTSNETLTSNKANPRNISELKQEIKEANNKLQEKKTELFETLFFFEGTLWDALFMGLVVPAIPLTTKQRAMLKEKF